MILTVLRYWLLDGLRSVSFFVETGHIKRALSSLGLPSAPYSYLDVASFPDIATAIAMVMRNLDINIFFAVDFEEVPTSVMNAPAGRRIVVRKASFR